jgi:hypothetical protein
VKAASLFWYLRSGKVRHQPMKRRSSNLVGVVQTCRGIIRAIEKLEQCLFLTSHTNEEHLLTASGIRTGILRAQTHRVVLAERGFDLIILCQQIFHQRKAAIFTPTPEIRRSDHLKVGWLNIGQHAIGAVQSNRIVSRSAAQHDRPSLPTSAAMSASRASSIANGSGIYSCNPEAMIAASTTTDPTDRSTGKQTTHIAAFVADA